ncbi:hypothetical protein N7456_003847 [Penicillium angulare]|uniref:Uncharacterized protein n=1 Tax=Penicillium angulare TaxID=116970 RepID=A0A9W9FVJ9_9EURO|nr:hypothetical protein N7456_003847 [Penicillium angulare]
MSGLEIVALIPAIVSAIAAVTVECRAWRKRKKERLAKTENLELETLLHESGPVVKSKHASGLQRFEEDFRIGDSIGHEALMEHLIVVQTTEISVLRRRNINITDHIHPNHSLITRDTKSARGGIISALSQQYQRLAQADPSPRPLSATSEPHTEDTNHSYSHSHPKSNGFFHAIDIRQRFFGRMTQTQHGSGHNHGAKRSIYRKIKLWLGSRDLFLPTLIDKFNPSYLIERRDLVDATRRDTIG